jgi:DNA-binding transcriptional LysR family regulator
MRPLLKKNALYSDETEMFRTPMEVQPGDTVTIRQLEGQSIVTGLRGSMEDHSMNYLIRKENIHFKRIYRSDSMNTMMELVRQGQGIILGPESFGEYYHVRAIPFTPPKVVDLNFISLRERAEEPAIRDFRKYLLEMAKAER